MHTIRVKDFNLRQIAESGQCFRMTNMEPKKEVWNQNGNFLKDVEMYRLIAGSRYLELCQKEEELIVSCDEKEWDEIWYSYFDCGRDYGAIKASIDPADRYLKEASQKGWGIRILKQDLWEMILTFIISQQNNIPRIRKCVEAICSRYGEKKKNFYGEIYYGFPTPQVLAEAKEQEIRDLNLGYRSKYIVKTAKMITEGEVKLKKIPCMGYEEAKAEVMKLSGVGVKVADCICLFGLHHVEAFPVDTHIKKVLKEHYPTGFPFDRYEGYAGILQQYIFYQDLI